MTVSTFEQLLCLCRHHGFIVDYCRQIFGDRRDISVTVESLPEGDARFSEIGKPDEVFRKLSEKMDEYYRQNMDNGETIE